MRLGGGLVGEYRPSEPWLSVRRTGGILPLVGEYRPSEPWLVLRRGGWGLAAYSPSESWLSVRRWANPTGGWLCGGDACDARRTNQTSQQSISNAREQASELRQINGTGHRR